MNTYIQVTTCTVLRLQEKLYTFIWLIILYFLNVKGNIHEIQYNTQGLTDHTGIISQWPGYWSFKASIIQITNTQYISQNGLLGNANNWSWLVLILFSVEISQVLWDHKKVICFSIAILTLLFDKAVGVKQISKHNTLFPANCVLHCGPYRNPLIWGVESQLGLSFSFSTNYLPYLLCPVFMDLKRGFFTSFESDPVKCKLCLLSLYIKWTACSYKVIYL